MTQRLPRVALAATVALSALVLPAQAERSTQADQKELAVTIYNDDLGLVREVRELKLDGGLRELQFADVAAKIDPTSVSLQSLSAPEGLQVLEQNYEYDLLTPSKLLDKYVGQEVEIVNKDGTTSKARLLSTNDGQIYQIGDRIHLYAPGNVVLPKVPDNLVARPTLKWLLQNGTAGPQRAEISYLTHGMSWRANYVLVLNAADTASALNGWVTLTNRSGATYPAAKLTLVAGDVNRVRQPRYEPQEYRAMKVADAPAGQFAEKALFEYHSYQLNRPTTLKDNQEKQMSLLSAAGVPTVKLFRFDPPSPPVWYQNAERRSQKVSVYLQIQNRKQDHLGIPLPKGVVRVYKQDADGKLQFVGEDALDHTPRDEKLRVKLGEAFDLVGERRQTNFRVLGERQVEAAYEIVLRNHKDEPVTVTAGETLGGSWEITAKSHPYAKVSATQVDFTVKVNPNKEERITYTVRTNY